MAYSVHNIAAITDIPILVGSFAATNGFDVDNTDPNAPIITCPGDSNSTEENLPFQLRALITGSNHDLWWEEAFDSNSLADDDIARITSPKLSGAPDVSLPTRLHIFGTAVGTINPFIAVVVEYGFNSYRHLYFGKLEVFGTISGRECIAACGGPRTSSASVRNWYDPNAGHFLFSGFSQAQGVGNYGGARLIHANNPTEWRRFDAPITTSSPLDEYTNQMLVGGWGDAFNDGYVTRAISAFAGQNILVPINLYAPEPISGGTDTSFVPVGRPPGVRMVHMRDLEPGQQIEVGNETWRVFAAWTKRDETQMVAGTNNWPTFETSHYLGYAYLEEDTP